MLASDAEDIVVRPFYDTLAVIILSLIKEGYRMWYVCIS
jgi:hypothetical protein